MKSQSKFNTEVARSATRRALQAIGLHFREHSGGMAGKRSPDWNNHRFNDRLALIKARVRYFQYLDSLSGDDSPRLPGEIEFKERERIGYHIGGDWVARRRGLK